MPLHRFSGELLQIKQPPSILDFSNSINSVHFLNLLKAKENLFDSLSDIIIDKFILSAKKI